MLKKITAILFAIIIAPAAYANCRTLTILVDGKVIICTVCCYMGGNCTTTCV